MNSARKIYSRVSSVGHAKPCGARVPRAVLPSGGGLGNRAATYFDFAIRSTYRVARNKSEVLILRIYSYWPKGVFRFNSSLPNNFKADGGRKRKFLFARRNTLIINN